jgi:hypothetical protein
MVSARNVGDRLEEHYDSRFGKPHERQWAASNIGAVYFGRNPAVVSYARSKSLLC